MKVRRRGGARPRSVCVAVAQELRVAELGPRHSLAVMRWLIGIDLGGRSNGALQLAGWLLRTATEPVHFVVAHVIDERMWGPHDVADALRPSAEQALALELGTSGLPQGSYEAKVVTARTVVDGLAELARASACDGVILGRIAPRRSHTLVRLGAVARRMLRRLPLPVMITPPDFSESAIGAGPVVLGTDLDTDSATAGRLARRIAGELDRGLLVVHVDPSYTVVPDYVGGGAVIIPRPSRHIRADVETWASTSGVEAPVIRIADGGIVEQLLAEGEREGAPMLVVGSRRLSLAERIFSSSVGSDLARLADRPVLVVPAQE